LGASAAGRQALPVGGLGGAALGLASASGTAACGPAGQARQRPTTRKRAAVRARRAE